MKIEESYVMVKPEFAESVEAIKEIKSRLLKSDLFIRQEGFVRYDKDAAQRHYEEHIGKGFYQELEDYITSGKAYGMVVVGEDVINKVRYLVQRDKKAGLQKGDIRYDIPKMLNREFDMTKNVIHASDKPESAKKEIEIFNELLFNKIYKKEHTLEK